MCHFHNNYPWYQLGIDLVLGSGIDYKLSTREKQFAPEALESMMRGATITDSLGNKIPIVKKETIIHKGVPAQLPPPPFVLSPDFIFSIIFVITLMFSIKDFKKQKSTRWLDSAIYGIYAIASLFICFLIFISINEATSPNFMILLFIPLCFIPTKCILIKNCNKFAFNFLISNIVALILLLIVLHSGVQVSNDAVMPLILISLTRSAINIYISQCVAKKTK